MQSRSRPQRGWPEWSGLRRETQFSQLAVLFMSSQGRKERGPLGVLRSKEFGRRIAKHFLHDRPLPPQEILGLGESYDRAR